MFKGLFVLCLLASFTAQAHSAKNASMSQPKDLDSTSMEESHVVVSDKNLMRLISVNDIAFEASYVPSPYLYCAYYKSGNVSGYSLFRRTDHADIGSAVWRNSISECEAAASVANSRRVGIVCAPYVNKGQLQYSIFRIHDNKDLGTATISTFGTCQEAVRAARRDIVCSTFVKDGRTWWSPYSISTGQDLGTALYADLATCARQF